ncbi:hypothetical protein [Hymenobacter sp. HDW8]|uniref:hypothetical protein n=1 Tax=Hymenobacter sp. HDW8 TaxID=2714932 RepID=UPI00140A1BC9|nr:hypothetical protein [Hymenobacter sp. HDW8]QIL76223.1 hypothetical protein G7064_10420 [Hymenobacter sp. HDW8]
MLDSCGAPTKLTVTPARGLPASLTTVPVRLVGSMGLASDVVGAAGGAGVVVAFCKTDVPGVVFPV